MVDDSWTFGNGLGGPVGFAVKRMVPRPRRPSAGRWSSVCQAEEKRAKRKGACPDLMRNGSTLRTGDRSGVARFAVPFQLLTSQPQGHPCEAAIYFCDNAPAGAPAYHLPTRQM